jgi:hypothetical protein
VPKPEPGEDALDHGRVFDQRDDAHLRAAFKRSMERDLASRTLRIAASLLGGPRRLAHHLGVSAPDVIAWLSGSTEPPREAFLRALEVILKDLEARDP